MERKSEAAYTTALNYLVQEVPIVPTIVMSDYEEALRRAIRAVWPETEIKGCWFHYARAVYRKSRQLGLLVSLVLFTKLVKLFTQNCLHYCNFQNM